MKTLLKKNEKVILETRPHWFTLVGPSLLVIIGSTVGVIIKSYGYLAVIILIVYLIYKIVQRNNNLWAVTNLRVIDEYGVFSYLVMEMFKFRLRRKLVLQLILQLKTQRN